MTLYEKPIVLATEDLAEGVYAASGGADGGPDCYTITPRLHQIPESGPSGNYRFQCDGVHAAADGHHSGEQILVITFTQPVTYVSSNGNYLSGNGTTTLRIQYIYHNNAYDQLGLGDVVVYCDKYVNWVTAVIECNYDCGQH